MPPSEKTKRIIWTKFGGRCALCREVLCVDGISPEVSHLIGDVAHIVAEQEDGPRGLSPLTLEERNSEKNLLLLCLRHHKIIDDDPPSYTTDDLSKLSSAHQDWVTSSLSLYPVWNTKLFHLYYINVPRLSLLAALQGISLDLSRYGQISALHKLGWELNSLMGGFLQLLQRVQLRAVPLDAAMSQKDVTGMVVSFEHKFRTKNIRLPESGESFETIFTGDLDSDPHIYTLVNGYKIVANIDLRWITTTTAFVQFRPSGGQNRFAGIGFVNSLDSRNKIAVITPYVLGLASNPFMEEFWEKATAATHGFPKTSQT